MNKHIRTGTFFLTVLASLLLCVSSVHAADPTRVRGNAYASGDGAPGASVAVTCGGITKNVVTDSNGLYTVDFTNAQCPQHAGVNATTTYNGQSQSQTVFVSSDYRATLDFYFEATSVPEFGLLGSIGATGTSIAALWALRRRHA
jgi:hypothetical protein